MGITDHKGRETAYEWGILGERKSITYPDELNKKVEYLYDKDFRLQTLMDGEHHTEYHYDQSGRLSEKQFPNGMKTTYLYNSKGLLSDLIHEDTEGILDRYSYTYDDMGNKTAIEKQRRNLEKESGRWEYS